MLSCTQGFIILVVCKDIPFRKLYVSTLLFSLHRELKINLSIYLKFGKPLLKPHDIGIAPTTRYKLYNSRHTILMPKYHIKNLQKLLKLISERSILNFFDILPQILQLIQEERDEISFASFCKFLTRYLGVKMV